MVANHYHVTRTATGRTSKGWTLDPVGDYPADFGQPESVVIDATDCDDDEASRRAHSRLVAVFGEKI